MIKPYVWPQGKRCAFVLSVLFDDGLDAAAKEPSLFNRSKSFSVWKYGANRGVERLCEVFSAYNMKSTWFVPGEVATLHASLLRIVTGGNHRLESHGWNFERYESLTDSETCELLLKSRGVLEDISGTATTGFRLPAGNWPPRMSKLLLESGYRWSASLNGDDVPYFHENKLVEIPVHLDLEDRPYFQFNFTPAFPKGLSRLPSYESVLNNWISEFDAYRHFGLCFVLQLRPEMTGTPGRIFLAEKLLEHIRTFEDVWIASGSEVAEWHAENGSQVDKNHPLNVFRALEKESHVSG